MDSSLLTFLVNSPEHAVPFPWERVYDLRTNMLMYKNQVSKSLVVDLRSRVNIGGGMYYESSWWQQLMSSRPSVDGFFYNMGFGHSRHCLIRRRYDHDHPFVLQASCCFRPPARVFLVIPEPVWSCPLCDNPFPIFI